MKLAFYRGATGDYLDRLIASQDKPYRYSHVELVFSDGLSFSSSWRDGGVRFKFIEFDDSWDFLNFNLYSEKIIDKWCAAHVGGKYDVPGVLALKLPFFRENLNWWFCSEICTAALQQAGYFKGIKPHKVTPNLLWDLASLQLPLTA